MLQIHSLCCIAFDDDSRSMDAQCIYVFSCLFVTFDPFIRFKWFFSQFLMLCISVAFCFRLILPFYLLPSPFGFVFFYSSSSSRCCIQFHTLFGLTKNYINTLFRAKVHCSITLHVPVHNNRNSEIYVINHKIH